MEYHCAWSSSPRSGVSIFVVPLPSETQVFRSGTHLGSMDRLSLGMVQRFAFSETLFYGKTPQVHRHLIYTDPSLRPMEEPLA